MIIITAIKIMLLLYALNFLKYAKTHETIDVNEWLTSINTKGNRALFTAIIVIYMIVQIFGGILTSAINSI